MDDGATPEPGTDDDEPAEPASRRGVFWPSLLTAVLAHQGLVWILDGLPAERGEPLLLRWLRALALHPVRGPLGLALAAAALAELTGALLNRHPRT